MQLNMYSAQASSPTERVTAKMLIVPRLRNPDLGLAESDSILFRMDSWGHKVT